MAYVEVLCSILLLPRRATTFSQPFSSKYKCVPLAVHPVIHHFCSPSEKHQTNLTLFQPTSTHLQPWMDNLNEGSAKGPSLSFTFGSLSLDHVCSLHGVGGWAPGSTRMTSKERKMKGKAVAWSFAWKRKLYFWAIYITLLIYITPFISLIYPLPVHASVITNANLPFFSALYFVLPPVFPLFSPTNDILK